MKSIFKALAIALSMSLAATVGADWRIKLECKGQARMSQDIAYMLEQGIPPDRINFVDPDNVNDETIQPRGEGIVANIQKLQARGYTPEIIYDEVFSTCISMLTEQKT